MKVERRTLAAPLVRRKAHMINDRYLRRSEVERIAGLSRSTIYRRIEQGTFPRPYVVGAGAVRWRETDLVSWQTGHQLTGSAAND
jgi:prophage regulatory protein